MNNQFVEVLLLIQKSRNSALKTVNTELIGLYWKIGEYISSKIKTAEWGEGTVDKLAEYIQRKYPELKGYSNKNLWRMKQFYEIYNKDIKLSPLVRQLSWTHNLFILSKTKSKQEREFYLRLSIQEQYSKRELERQINSGYFERTVLSREKLSALPGQLKYGISKVFRDTYILDFLNLPKSHSETDLRNALVNSFKSFVLEFGRDFAFVGEEYKISVGKNDYFIDLLFYHRELQCLVAFELKINDFKPEYIGQINFYLEALDRTVKKKHENPSVGVILCKSKDTEVVEYALSRNASPTLISEYKTKLIPKRVLREKLRELFFREEEK
ncbi:DUF1016 domain-containing protein [Candidatus Woesearchaeota archaeon]|nr:DUF1016 domain-containing protein [Candidatus Woesearchaeota archaeon]